MQSLALFRKRKSQEAKRQLMTCKSIVLLTRNTIGGQCNILDVENSDFLKLYKLLIGLYKPFIDSTKAIYKDFKKRENEEVELRKKKMEFERKKKFGATAAVGTLFVAAAASFWAKRR